MVLYLQIFFTTLAVSFGILHLIIYFYNPRSKSNLFFAIFLFFYSTNIFFDYQSFLATTRQEALGYLRIHRGVVAFNPIFALLFTYYAFDFRIPRHFWLITASLLIAGFFAVLDPVNNFDYLQYMGIIVTLEAIRIFKAALRKKLYQAWIIVTGYGLLFLFSSYDLLMDLNLIKPVGNIVNGYPVGFLCLIIFTSIYLARDFARKNKIIITQEREARDMEMSRMLLEAEDKRKARELNEARDLQLSLLPQCINNLENYDICFDMRTAFEVGGDYYDYLVSQNGEIFLVIGDATDHGMKAGMMVSIVKGLFLSQVTSMENKAFLNHCSSTIKQMKLKNLYMALMLLKINGHQLTASSAGIPPIFIHRQKKDQIEEYVMKGMPLGAFDSFPYETLETKLDVGDTVLLMTDGLSELFNKDNETFGYDRIKEIFLQNAHRQVNEIVNALFSAGKGWLKDHKQNDDITLIALRPKKDTEQIS
ncbi:MAG: PP2C family protein-serine/threonine phosphatase [bacterium]